MQDGTFFAVMHLVLPQAVNVFQMHKIMSDLMESI